MDAGRLDAGRLDRRLQFSARREVEDGAGNTVAEYVPQFEAAANLKYLRGGEGVLAARLEAKQPVIVTIRNRIAARQVTNDWQATDTRTGMVYAVKETPRESDDRGFLEMLVMSGVVA